MILGPSGGPKLLPTKGVSKVSQRPESSILERERQKKVLVGKNSKNKRGGVLKKVCKKSESKGCRASGGGRKDRFLAYKAAVKHVFMQELENGQEVARVPGLYELEPWM